MFELNPQVVVWEYTLKCNSNCIHCGSDAKLARENELNTEESLDLVEQIADLGFKLVVLSGGEPTLREDWVEIAEKIQSKDMKVGIISNALAWNEKTIEDMIALNPYSVGFSVDGDENLHDQLRGAKGSHRKIFDSIRELRKSNVTTCAVTAVNKKNLKELVDIRNWLIVYGVDAWQIQTASPMGRMADNKDIVLDEDDHYKLGEFIVESRERLPHINIQGADCIGYYGKLEKKLRDSEWNGCQAGLENIGIDSDGTVRGCLSIRSPEAIEGNIRETPLREIWENQNKFKYTRQFNISDLKGRCNNCENGLKCRGGCQSQSMAFFNEFHNAPYCFSKYEGK